jgi:hypothetical protein
LSTIVVVALAGLAALPTSAWALPTAPPGFQYCATEGQSCTFPATPLPNNTEIAYGANGSFTYWLYAQSPFPCSNEAFHYDPAPGFVKACFTITGPPGFYYCGPYGGTCMLPKTTNAYVVALGAGTNFAYHDHVSGTANVACNTAALGGPDPGNPHQACFVGPPDQPGYDFCAPEGDLCRVSSTTDLSSTVGAEYGAGSSFTQPLYTSGTIPCINGMFGDPDVGVPKACFKEVVPPGYTYCATEGGTCQTPGPSDIAYGAAGSFTYSYFSIGGNIACDNGFGDPTPGVVKACFVALN